MGSAPGGRCGPFHSSTSGGRPRSPSRAGEEGGAVGPRRRELGPEATGTLELGEARPPLVAHAAEGRRWRRQGDRRVGRAEHRQAGDDLGDLGAVGRHDVARLSRRAIERTDRRRHGAVGRARGAVGRSRSTTAALAASGRSTGSTSTNSRPRASASARPPGVRAPGTSVASTSSRSAPNADSRAARPSVRSRTSVRRRPGRPIVNPPTTSTSHWRPAPSVATAETSTPPDLRLDFVSTVKPAAVSSWAARSTALSPTGAG